MPTFERYILKKLLIGLTATVSVLLLIIGSRLFTRLLDRVSESDYTYDSILLLFSIGLMNSLVYILPFSAMLTAILVLRNLYYSNEMYAAFSLCVSRARIYKVLLYFGVPLALLLLYLMMEIIPHFNHQYVLIKEKSKQHTALQMLPTGRFVETDTGGVLFVEKNKEGQIDGVFVASATAEIIETAPSGQHIKDTQQGNVFELLYGHIYQNANRVDDFMLFSYDTHRILVPTTPLQYRHKASMLDVDGLLTATGPEVSAQWQLRWAVPISVILLLLLAEPLSRTSPRQSSYLRIVASIVIFLAYLNLISFTVKMVENEVLPPYPGVWAVLLIFAVTIAVYTKRKRGVG